MTALIFTMASVRVGHFGPWRSILRNCLAHSVNQRAIRTKIQMQTA